MLTKKKKGKQGQYEKNHVLIYLSSMLKYVINRLMHAFFHIKTVIIPRDRYWPEGFSPRVDIGRGHALIYK
jgi:hypothetical protein